MSKVDRELQFLTNNGNNSDFVDHNRDSNNRDISNRDSSIGRSSDRRINQRDVANRTARYRDKEKERVKEKEREREKEREGEKGRENPSPHQLPLPPIQSYSPLSQSRTLLLAPHTRHSLSRISNKKSKSQSLPCPPHRLDRGQRACTAGEGLEGSTTSKECTAVSTGLLANAEPAFFSLYEKKKKMNNHQISVCTEDKESETGAVHPHNIGDTSTPTARTKSSIKDRISALMRERKENLLSSNFKGQNPGVSDLVSGHDGEDLLENIFRTRIPGVKSLEKSNSLFEGDWEALPVSRRSSKSQLNGGQNPGVIFPKRNSFIKQKKSTTEPEESLSLRDLLPIGPSGVLFRDFPSFPPLVSAG